MLLTIYQIDAFAETLFRGNPAAVIPLEKWIDEDLMQKIAMENNLSETAFFTPHTLPSSESHEGTFNIRWFTPEAEANLCGHATLASAFVLYQQLEFKKPEIIFYSNSGPLKVSRSGDLINLDFPSWGPERMELYHEDLLPSLGNPEIAGVYKHRDYLVEFYSEEAVRTCEPDFNLMKKVGENVIITAPGGDRAGRLGLPGGSPSIDFVSRFFAPSVGINEDPVTGSAHSQLIPFWSLKLGKKKMQARQLSPRGGDITCEQKGDRVAMGGKCVYYMKGEIQV